MTEATRVRPNLDQRSGRSPSVSQQISGGQQDTRYLGEDIKIDAVVVPAYTLTARVLHWITALLILSVMALGVVIANKWGGSAEESLYDVHRSIAAVIVPLIIVRLIYRWMHPPLPLPDDVPAMQTLAAQATHWGFYALLIVQPLTGWIATSAYRAAVTIFGWFELPPIWFENRAFSEQLFAIHRQIGVAIACLAVAHMGAAIYHHFVRRDRILMRMITGSPVAACLKTDWLGPTPTAAIGAVLR
jgi:cytochrome b561